MMVADFTYPVSRTYFYFGLVSNDVKYFTVCAVMDGFSTACDSMALWLFSIKMWALA